MKEFIKEWGVFILILSLFFTITYLFMAIR
ncbi:hypothetical protein SaSA341_1485 [Streptococcus agalactiae]|nr:hypothetical protein SaSA341_1485 [Streptococcus agalactiae]AUP37063.1 hypothetical protein SaSA374_1484 [Streptococcus agalactiae]